MRKIKFSTFLLVWLLSISPLLGDVRLPKTLTSHAVLQRDVPVKVWGWADSGEKVVVAFNNQTAETIADKNGRWCVTLAPMAAKCEGSDLVVSGKNSITLSDVVVGEVWICSGQSNMAWTLGAQAGTEEERQGNYSFIRFNRDGYVATETEQEELSGNGWFACENGIQNRCTAVGFHFALALHEKLNVPIGLIDCNWGGARIESWMPDDCWKELEEKGISREEIAKSMSTRREGHTIVGGMFNAKLAPWRNYAVRGAIWYQGCSNAGEGLTYYEKQKAMIASWRKIWGDIPFYWVQLANYLAPDADPNERRGWAAFRDAQTKCLEVAKTGQAITIDIGEEKDVHPRNKYDVGRRLAAWALANDYGFDVPFASPIFQSVKFEGAKAIVAFDHVGKGLVVGKQEPRKFSVSDAPLYGFAIAGADKKYFRPTAKIVDKNTVELSCEEVPVPKYVRYAWQQNPAGCNLYNAEGFPATPFSTE
ncbi:MAG: sialate O-acetylesterase [Planctomycetia bacterium]|nr:sialate O-acetylesterase [Planctomycetia bacterium]